VFQGTPIFTFFSGEADYLAMDQAGYDALTVGNHDMDNGLANLQKQAKLLHIPLLSVNMIGKNGQLVFPGYHVFERGGLKIAVIGVMGQNAYEAIAGDRRKDIAILDPVDTLRQVVPQLRDKVDLVVVLSHVGHEEEVALASKVPGIDLIVGGHSHTKVPKPVAVQNGDRTTLVVQAFQWGEYVGRLDLTVDAGRIQSYTGELVPVTNALQPDPTVKATVDKYASQLAAQMSVVVGKSAYEFDNGRKSEGDTPLGNLIADCLREQTNVDIGIMNSGGIRSGLPKGDLTRGAIFSMLPFENRLVTLKVKGTTVQAILDFAASRLGKNGTLQVSGVSFVGEHEKAVEVKVGGKPLDPNKVYTLTTIDYIASGNDGAEVFKQASDVHPTGQLIRDAFFDFLKRHPLIDAPPTGRIQKR
jgi:2',3'-cyclic-nucleotide 2'-phosphodiesterase (5'-nucleotidase family)